MTNKEILISEIQDLSENLTEEVLDYVQYLKLKKVKKPAALPEGKDLGYFLSFVGSIGLEDLKTMAQEIEAGCERIEPNEW